MRTTVRLDDHLLHEAKEHAARTNRTLTAVIEDALRQFLHQARRETTGPRQAVSLPTYRGQGPQPGVDLDDTVALLDLMESDG